MFNWKKFSRRQKVIDIAHCIKVRIHYFWMTDVHPHTKSKVKYNYNWTEWTYCQVYLSISFLVKLIWGNTVSLNFDDTVCKHYLEHALSAYLCSQKSRLLLVERDRFKLIFGISGFDSNPCQSASDTSQKVKKLVSKLVEESFGESIDVVSLGVAINNILYY